MKSSDTKFFGFDPVFSKFIEEIKILESEKGMTLKINGGSLIVHGTLASVCADTKGAHEMFGLMSPSADKFCRLCLISRKEILSHPTAESVDLRNRKDHDLDVKKAKEFGNQANTGVSNDCLLNGSQSFHVAENYIMDSMHDVLEGIDPFCIMLCLRFWITHKPEYGIKASVLNSRKQRFNFGPYDDKNKPSENFQDVTIKKIGNYTTKQRASQQWCLMRKFPLLIGDLVPDDDQHFGLLLKLLDIMDVIFCPINAIEDTVNLSRMIEELFALFKILFPEVNPINKFHHIIHYPEILRQNGPSMGYWCMRFEAHHNLYKRVSHMNCNFKNVTKSVADHLALALCSNLQDKNSFIDKPTSFGPFKCCIFRELGVMNAEYNIFQNNEEVKTPNWIKIGGWIYFEDTVVVLQWSIVTKKGLPKFAKITKLILNEKDEPFAVVETLKTIMFQRHFHSYEVEEKIQFKMKIINLMSITEEPLWFNSSFEDDSILYINPMHLI